MEPSVLCVDDDRGLCQILGRALSSEGYRVRMAHDGDEALARLREESADLAFVDILLPKRDGFGVLEEIRRAGGTVAGTPVVLLSGCSRTPQYIERASALGAQALLTKPVTLEELLATAARHVTRPQARRALRSAPPAAQPSTATPVPSPAFCGSLAALPFPALLNQLHSMHASGLLHLESGRKRKALQLRHGEPIAVKSNLVNECLGNLLVRSGRISEQAMEESLQRAKRGEGFQGEILVAMQILSEQEVVAALRAQAEEKLLEIFSWLDGSFRLEPGARLRGGTALAGERSVTRLVLEGVQRRAPREPVDEFLRANAAAYLALRDDPLQRIEELALEPRDAELVRALDGRQNVGSLLEEGEATRRTFYGLMVSGLIALRSRPPGLEASRTPTPAARALAPEPRAEVQSHAASNAQQAELSRLAERLRGASHFEALGVTETASGEDVRRAYVALAKRTHPDRYRGSGEAVRRLAAEIFGVISQAHDTLCNPARRAEYLLERRRGRLEAKELEAGQRALEAELQFQKGEARLARRDYKGALEAYGWALQHYPEEGEYHAHYGWVLYLNHPEDSGMIQEALEHVRRGAKLAPDRDKPYLFLGRLLKQLSRLAQAEKMFVRAVEINPDCVEALRELRLMNMRRDKEKGRIGRWLRRPPGR